MNEDTLRRAAEVLGKMAGDPSQVHVLWHGGEPMVLAPDYYWRAGEILDDILPGHSESMQTSLIPYREGFAGLIKARFRGEVGSSIDFSSRLVAGSSERYQTIWLRKVAEARLEGIEVIPGVVPSRAELGHGRAIVEFMAEHGFGRFNFDRYNAFGKKCGDPMQPSNREHAEFLSEIFDVLMEAVSQGRHAPVVRVIVAALRGVLHGLPGDRWGTKCLSSNLVVEPNGDVNNCPDKAFFEPPLGTVEEGAEGVVASPARKTWIRLQSVGRMDMRCHDCAYFSWCRGGCPISGSVVDASSECSGFRRFIERVEGYAALHPEVVAGYLGAGA